MSNNNQNTIDKLSKRIKYYKVGLIILGILAFLVIFGVVKQKNNFAISGFELLDPSRIFLDDSDYIINIQKLRDYLQIIGEQYPDSISIYYEQLNSGSNISINKDLRLFPASLSKLVQAIIITKKIENGILSWNQKLPTKIEDISSDSGELYKTIEGQSFTVEDLLKELLVNSDNTAQNIFRHYLEVEDYIQFQDATGLLDLYNEKGYISAKEYTRLLRVLYTSTYLDPKNSEKILEYMTQSTFFDYLSQGIPSDIKFAHKYGENIEEILFADSGIVYVPKRPYMITVMIKGKDSSEETRAWAVGLMKEISEHAYAVSK